MARQWAVVVRPDSTHVVRALGPIKDRDTAERVVRRISEQEDRIDGELDALGYSTSQGWIPQAVELESVAEFMAEMSATNGEDLT